MKKIFLLLISIISVTVLISVIFYMINRYVRNNADLPKPNIALNEKVKFDRERFDFGKTTWNKPVLIKFVFQNISKAPIIVENVITSCGCTTSNYSKEPISPGKKGEIDLIYDAGAIGHVFKTGSVKFKGINQKKNLVITGGGHKKKG